MPCGLVSTHRALSAPRRQSRSRRRQRAWRTRLLHRPPAATSTPSAARGCTCRRFRTTCSSSLLRPCLQRCARASLQRKPSRDALTRPSTQTLLALPLVCRAWAALRSRDALWRAAWALRGAGPLPRRPRGSLFTLLLKAEAGAARRSALAHDELLRRVYLVFCKHDSVQSMRALLARHASGALNINAEHSIMEGNSLANLAARCGALRCLRCLYHDYGADLETADVGGFTPLLNAAWRGDAPMVRWLLEVGADATTRGRSRGAGPASAAEWARVRGYAALADELAAAEASALARKSGAAAEPGAGGGAPSPTRVCKRRRTRRDAAHNAH